MDPQSVDEFSRLARRRLPSFLSEYIDGGSYSEQTLRKNSEDLLAIELRQRVLRDVASVDAGIDLFGSSWSVPFGLGPVGMSGMFARRGEVQAALAAKRANLPFCLSTLSICGLEEVYGAVNQPFWYQLYMLRDRAVVSELLDRACQVGCSALVFTVDMPVPATRYRDFRSGLSGTGGAKSWKRLRQALSRPGWVYDVALRGRPHAFGNLAFAFPARRGLDDCVAWISKNFDATVSWRDLGWIRENWKRPLIIKGVMDVDDAKEAAAIGADGIVVSNHGGRQFDGVSSTARVLPRIAAEVGGRLAVLADGGVRSGVDVLRMLGLGAQGVLLGRAWAYALAAGGTSAISRLIETVSQELKASMAMAGCTTVKDVDRRILYKSSR